EEGSCVTIICSFNRYGMETGIWWKNPIYDLQTKDYNKTTVYHEDESIVDPEFKGRTEYLGDRKTNCSFKIKHLQLNDSGIYNFRFIGKNNYKWMNKQGVNLLVTNKPKGTHILIAKEELNEGDSLTIECLFSSCNPNITSYTWYGNGKLVNPESGSTLEISDVTYQSDKYKYECEVKNEVGSSRSNPITLKVAYSPKETTAISRPADDIKEGAAVTLVCSCKGNPPVNFYTWYKVGQGIINNSETFEFNSISITDNGLVMKAAISAAVLVVALLICLVIAFICSSSRQGRSRSQPPPSEAEVVYSTVAKPAPAQKGRGTENPHWATRNNCQDQETLNYASLQFQGTSEQQKGSAGKERVRGKEAISDIYSTVCKPRKPTEQEKGDYENYKVPPGARKQKDDEDDCEELNYSTIVIPTRVNKWESESDEEDEEEERTQYTHLKL
ncbi:UNVERIFIED_CONTAM: hypothetical protein FKN15_069258, partial [Acipenser sinensis]